ncbi:hypothetical protein EVAR_8459_1 [Eumeta japonica]|uniref:Uncharacterized protein n=1 Tax=Eumeta variegata TaxID=151549 RepID=A0A4C1WD66_EUMVA|nr:hypothetical protein EVAR_8459_1 [Eumeta japonica]
MSRQNIACRAPPAPRRPARPPAHFIWCFYEGVKCAHEYIAGPLADGRRTSAGLKGRPRMTGIVKDADAHNLRAARAAPRAAAADRKPPRVGIPNISKVATGTRGALCNSRNCTDLGRRAPEGRGQSNCRVAAEAAAMESWREGRRPPALGFESGASARGGARAGAPGGRRPSVGSYDMTHKVRFETDPHIPKGMAAVPQSALARSAAPAAADGDVTRALISPQRGNVHLSPTYAALCLAGVLGSHRLHLCAYN